MSTQKRRVIYMTDQEWAGLIERAKLRDISASEFIRASIGGGFLTPESFLADPKMRDLLGKTPLEFNPVPKPSQRKAK